MYRVLVSDPLSPQGLAILRAAPEIEVDVKTGLDSNALREIIGGYDALIIRSATQVTADLLAAASRLKVVGRAGIGVDNVDLEAATRRGVVVMNTPTGNAVTTAEHTLAMMFAVARHIPQATASMKAGKWEKKKFEGRELTSKTLGLLGLGNIGKVVADRALALKMRVLVYDPFLPPEKIRAVGAEPVDLEGLLAEADFLSVHTPLTDSTRGLIGDDAFSKVKKGVFVINCARGGIVDEAALLRALEEGRVAGAALDVFVEEPPPKDHPLLAHPRVICTPHLGASTEEAQEKVAVEVAHQIIAFLTRGELKNSVNVPSVSAEVLERLRPYLTLAEHIGSLQAQLAEQEPFLSVEVGVAGQVAELPQKPLVTAVLIGLLRSAVGRGVNFVNAQEVAKERGIALKITTRPAGDFPNEIDVLVKTRAGTRRVSGVVFTESGPRIVRLDRFLFEAVPEGQLLLVRNADRPGVVGHIGTLLGARGINISRLQVSLDPPSKEALSLWNIDSEASPEDLEEMKKFPHIHSVTQVKF